MAPVMGAIGVVAVSTLGRAVAVLVRQHVAMGHMRWHGVVRNVDLYELMRRGMQTVDFPCGPRRTPH